MSVNPRISVLTIKAHWFDINLVNVHALTDDKTQEGNDKLYGELENIVDTILNNRIQIILGDLIAKI